MSVQWMPYPRVGTSVEDGWWLCTVFEDAFGGLRVDILELIEGSWFDRCGEALQGGIVVAITWVPDPAGIEIRRQSMRATKGKL